MCYAYLIFKCNFLQFSEFLQVLQFCVFKLTKYLTQLNLLYKNAIISLWHKEFSLWVDKVEQFGNVIESLKDDAISVERLKHLVQNNTVKCGIAFINLHLSELSINLTNFGSIK